MLSPPPPLSLSPSQVTVRVLSTRNPAVLPNAVYTLRTAGNVYSQIIDNLHLDTVYNLTVQAGSNGLYGEGVSEVISTGPGLQPLPLSVPSFYPPFFPRFLLFSPVSIGP